MAEAASGTSMAATGAIGGLPDAIGDAQQLGRVASNAATVESMQAKFREHKVTLVNKPMF